MNPIDLLTQEYLDALNELTPMSSALGAYAMGMVTAAAVRAGYKPDRQLLEAARTAAPLPDELWTEAAAEQVMLAYSSWVEKQRKAKS